MPIINLSRITPYKALGIWKINESLNEINDLNKIEKLNIDNRIHEKKFKEKVAATMVIKKICEYLKLNYYGIKKNKAGKPFLIKNKANISISTKSNSKNSNYMQPQQPNRNKARCKKDYKISISIT